VSLPLRGTPIAVAAHPEARLIALAASLRTAPPRPHLPAEPGGEPVAAAAYATADAAGRAVPSEELHELQLLGPPGCGLPLLTYIAAASAAAAAGAKDGPGSAAAGTAAAAAAAGWAGIPLWRYQLQPGGGGGGVVSTATAATAAADAVCNLLLLQLSCEDPQEGLSPNLFSASLAPCLLCLHDHSSSTTTTITPKSLRASYLCSCAQLRLCCCWCTTAAPDDK
jgi:hypothetical protein